MMKVATQMANKKGLEVISCFSSSKLVGPPLQKATAVATTSSTSANTQIFLILINWKIFFSGAQKFVTSQLNGFEKNVSFPE